MNMIRTASTLALMLSVSQLALADIAIAPVQASLSVTNLNYTLTDLDQADACHTKLETRAGHVH
ncbi:MAG: hypothetical protein QM749_13630 [Aquabacterium sp.]